MPHRLYAFPPNIAVYSARILRLGSEPTNWLSLSARMWIICLDQRAMRCLVSFGFPTRSGNGSNGTCQQMCGARRARMITYPALVSKLERTTAPTIHRYCRTLLQPSGVTSSQPGSTAAASPRMATSCFSSAAERRLHLTGRLADRRPLARHPHPDPRRWALRPGGSHGLVRGATGSATSSGFPATRFSSDPPQRLRPMLPAFRFARRVWQQL